MKLHCNLLLIAASLMLTAQLCDIGFSQAIQDVNPPGPESSPSYLANPHVPTRAFPQVNLGGGREPAYVGAFSADGRFHAPSTLDRFLSPRETAEDVARQKAVPPWMLESSIRIREDLEPPKHAVAVAHPHSRLGDARDAIVTFVYGQRQVLQSPSQVTTDSTRRLVVSDPGRRAVHVFDPAGKTSFTIQGGGQRRLQLPAGVAVDGEDNIYIADSERGMLLVYDRNARFVRYIGNFHGESWYQRPTGIAIDRDAGHLFVADSPRNLIFMLDLQGTALKRLGKSRDGTGVGEFDYPTQIAVGGHEVVVLDAGGSRIQIMDAECNLVRSFRVAKVRSREADWDGAGLMVDQEGNIYVTDVAESTIRIYNRNGGNPVSFGQNGSRPGEFNGARGLWIDEGNLMYVADAYNLRVQLFQLSGENQTLSK